MKKRLLGFNNKKFKKTKKIDNFPKGLTHGFGPKMENFFIFFFGNTPAKYLLHDILKRKKRLPIL